MVRPRQRDSGISMILVVALVMIAIILVVASIVLWADFKDKERLQKSLKDELLRQQGIEAEVKAEIVKVLEPTGFVKKEGDELPKQEALDRMRKERDRYFSPERYALLPIEGGGKPLPAEQVEQWKKQLPETGLYGSLQKIVELAAAWTSHYKTRADQLAGELAIAENRRTTVESIKADLPKRKSEYIELLQKEIEAINKQTAAENEAYSARKAKLAEDRQKAEQETAADVEKYAADEIKVLNEIRELRRQLEELKTKEVIKHDVTAVHGKILNPDIQNRTAFIDIGSRERVVPGLKFLVGKRGVHNKFEFKARVEVKKAWMTTSEVAILEVYDAGRPVVEGDQIVNPLFSRERPLVVAFVGEDRPTRLRYTVDEASRRIREIGSTVRKDVTLDLDYVIFTEVGAQKQRDSYEAYRKAVFLEIPVAEASDLFRFLSGLKD
jgi:hypothetical protein